MHHCSTDPHRLAGKGGRGQRGIGGRTRVSVTAWNSICNSAPQRSLLHGGETESSLWLPAHRCVSLLRLRLRLTLCVHQLVVSLYITFSKISDQSNWQDVHSFSYWSESWRHILYGHIYICIYVKFQIINQGLRVIDPWLKSIRIRPGCFFKPWPGACLLSLVYRIIFFLLRAVAHLKPIINSIYQRICGKTEMQRNEYFLL